MTSDSPSEQCSKPKLLVHAHVFYQNMWAELAQKLQSLDGYEVDLQITVTQESAEFERTVLAQYPHATITVVENWGFDIRPFIQLLQNKNLDCYDYVVKIHTKRDTPLCRLGERLLVGPDWRNASLSFLDSPETFTKGIEHFLKHPQCGMIASHLLTVKIASNSTDINNERLAQLLRAYKQKAIPKAMFVAGTMFVARAGALKPLSLISLDEFELRIKHDNLFAHTVERFMGHVIYAQGMSIQDPSWTISKRLVDAWENKICPFFYSAGITRKDHLFIKIFKIPLPYRFNEFVFRSYYERLLKEKQEFMQVVARASQVSESTNNR